MGKFNDPSADFIMEVLKTLDEEDLIPIAQFITQRLQEDTVIDVKPTPKPAPNPVNSNSPQLNIDTSSLQSLLNGDTIGSLLQLLVGETKTSEPAQRQSQPLASIFGNNALLSSLPTLLQVGTEVFQGGSSREERLIEAVVPFLSPQRRSSIAKLQNYLKIFNVVRNIPTLLANFNMK